MIISLKGGTGFGQYLPSFLEVQMYDPECDDDLEYRENKAMETGDEPMSKADYAFFYDMEDDK